MPQILLGILAIIGLVFLVRKLRTKTPISEKEEELKKVLDNSEVLDIEEQIEKEKLKQKGHIAKINKLKGKTND